MTSLNIMVKRYALFQNMVKRHTTDYFIFRQKRRNREFPTKELEFTLEQMNRRLENAIPEPSDFMFRNMGSGLGELSELDNKGKQDSFLFKRLTSLEKSMTS